MKRFINIYMNHLTPFERMQIFMCKLGKSNFVKQTVTPAYHYTAQIPCGSALSFLNYNPEIASPRNALGSLHSGIECVS